MLRDLKDLYDDFNDIKVDEFVFYRMFGKTDLGVSNIVYYCAKPYSIILDFRHNKIVGVIDVTSKTLLRFKLNRNLTALCKSAKITMSDKIYHIRFE